jgi:hypothetical protein
VAEVVVVVMRCHGRAVFCVTPIPLYLYFIDVEDLLLEDAVGFWRLGVFRLDVAVFFFSWLCGCRFDAALGGCVAGQLDDTIAEAASVATGPASSSSSRACSISSVLSVSSSFCSPSDSVKPS